MALTTGLREARRAGLALDEALADRLLEVVSGMKLREPQGQTPAQARNVLLTLNSLLQAGEPPPKRDLLTGK